MNYILNKNSKFNRKGNNRYFLKYDKSELQPNMDNIHNNFNNQNNIIKNNNIYNSNFFAVNKIKNNNNIMQNHNIYKKETQKKYTGIRPSHSIDNNFKFLYITNFKNIQPKTLSCKKQHIDKEEIKNPINNNNSNNTKETIPTIVQIQRLIDCLQNKNTNKNHYNCNLNKENDKLPSLINKVKPATEEIKPLIIKPQKIGKGGNDNTFIYSTNEIFNKVNNSKIKLKHINLKENEMNKVNKNNKIKYNKEDNINNIKIKKKNSIPKIRKPKVTIDKVRNIIKENLIIDNNGNDEKIVNIRLKMKPGHTKNYFNSNNNTIFMKTKKESINFCTSNYNNYKSDLMSLKRTFHYLENERTKKDMLFNKNQTMFKNIFNDKKYKEENEEYEEEENDPKRYSKYYLPSSGFGLLSRRND